MDAHDQGRRPSFPPPPLFPLATTASASSRRASASTHGVCTPHSTEGGAGGGTTSGSFTARVNSSPCYVENIPAAGADGGVVGGSSGGAEGGGGSIRAVQWRTSGELKTSLQRRVEVSLAAAAAVGTVADKSCGGAAAEQLPEVGEVGQAQVPDQAAPPPARAAARTADQEGALPTEGWVCACAQCCQYFVAASTHMQARDGRKAGQCAWVDVSIASLIA